MPEWQGKNLLCYGDNLTFLSDNQLFPDQCVDLIYLDPPFNSQQDYNVLFKETTGTVETAQIKAFEDTWRWDMAANEALARIHNDPAVRGTLADLMKTFMNFLKPSPMLAYLVQMAIRLVHMHRILKDTGTLYLHCDPTASHYLKLVLDGIFGARNFVNEISWKRTTAHSDTKQGMRRYGRIRDLILYYRKSEKWTFHPQFVPYSEHYADSFYCHENPEGRKFQKGDLTAARPGGDTEYEWRIKRRIGRRGKWEADLENEFQKPKAGHEYKGIRPYKGRFWAYSKENMTEFAQQGRLAYSRDGFPRYVRYLDEMPGVPLQDSWDDIPPVGARAAERMGYPTQKPIDLLLRIVSASSNPGDVVMDPFCGCGTTIDAVETLNREIQAENIRRIEEAKSQKKEIARVALLPERTWIGIDITHLSINLIKHRLTRFDPLPVYEVLGEPTSRSGANVLAKDDPFQFQYWALGLIGARPKGARGRKGADRGIDGVRSFLDEFKQGAPVYRTMLVQVKSGKVGVKDIRDLVGTMTREQAEMGVFITLENPTAPMKAEAASAGMYTSAWDKKPYPRVQVLTIDELLRDAYRPNPRCLLIPGGTGDQHTFAEAPKHKSKGKEQKKLFGGKEGS